MPDTIKGLIAGVVVPNLALRRRDVEAFEDTPLEYVRAELHISEVATPRQAAADVVKALGALVLTASAQRLKSRSLRCRRSVGQNAWKNTNAAVYLFEAVATRSGTLTVRLSPSLCADMRGAETLWRMQQGVTATNPNVNIVQWFGDNIFGDLQATAGGGVHPALQVDAIRYL